MVTGREAGSDEKPRRPILSAKRYSAQCDGTLHVTDWDLFSVKNSRSERCLDARRRKDVSEMGRATSTRRRNDGDCDGFRNGAKERVVKARSAAIRVYAIDEQFSSAEPEIHVIYVWQRKVGG